MFPKSKFSTLSDMRNFKAKYNFFIGLDSDGTIFDSMDLKHKKCFINPLIEIFNLQKISKIASITWNHINISSNKRGINRFEALVIFFYHLKKIGHKKKFKVKYPDLTLIEEWIKKSDILSDKSLREYIILSEKNQKKSDAEQVLVWSKRVNYLINNQQLKPNIFSGVEKALKFIVHKADIMVLSNTPLVTLYNDWKINDLNKYISIIGGQETGTKEDMLKAATFKKYDKNKILIIGDASSDYLSAKSNGCYFFPIIPKNEIISWDLFLKEGCINFFSEKYEKSYEEKLIHKFKKSLSTSLSWEN